MSNVEKLKVRRLELQFEINRAEKHRKVFDADNLIITFREMPEEPPLHGLGELSDILNSYIAALKEMIEDVDDELDELDAYDYGGER